MLGNLLAAVVGKEPHLRENNPDVWTNSISNATAAGVRVTPEKSLTLTTYYACLRNISEDLAKLPLKVYRRLKPRGKEALQDHPVYSLLHDAPNDRMTAMAWREMMTHYAIGWGSAYAEIERDRRGEPVAFWPIHPSRVTPKITKGKRLTYEVKTSTQLEHIAKGVVFQSRDILHIHGLGGDGLSGYALSVLAREAIALGLVTEQFGANFFGNGTTIAGVLRHPEHLSPEARKTLRDDWQTMHGSKGAHSVAILEEGIEWEQLGIPPEQAQFLVTREFQVEEIARWFRMPPHKIQHMKRSTFNNIESQSIEYVVDTLQAWATRWEQEIKRKLFADEPDIFAEHLFSGLLRGDMVKRALFYKNMQSLGVFSANDIRELENMNGIGPTGDIYYVGRNVVNVDVAMNETAPQPGSDKPDEPPTKENEETAAELGPLMHAAVDRVMTKTRKAVERAGAKYNSDEAGAKKWACRFFASQRKFFIECVLPVATAIVVRAGTKVDETAIVRQWANAECKVAEVGFVRACASKLGADTDLDYSPDIVGTIASSIISELINAS